VFQNLKGSFNNIICVCESDTSKRWKRGGVLGFMACSCWGYEHHMHNGRIPRKLQEKMTRLCFFFKKKMYMETHVLREFDHHKGLGLSCFLFLLSMEHVWNGDLELLNLLSNDWIWAREWALKFYVASWQYCVHLMPIQAFYL
jgi:hypothetical protein